MANDILAPVTTGDFSNPEIQQSFIPDNTQGVSTDIPVEQSFLTKDTFPTVETSMDRAQRYDFALDTKSPGIDQLSTEIQTGQDESGRMRRSQQERLDLNLRRGALLQQAIQNLPPDQITPEKVAEFQAMDKAEVDKAYADPRTFYERKFADNVKATVSTDVATTAENGQPQRFNIDSYNDVLINQASARKLLEDAQDAMKERSWTQAAKEWVPFYRWLKLSSAFKDPSEQGGFLLANNIKDQIEAAYRLDPDTFMKTQTDTINRLKDADPELALQYASALVGYTAGQQFSDTLANAFDLTMLDAGTAVGVAQLAKGSVKGAVRLSGDYLNNLKLLQMSDRLAGTMKSMAGSKIDYTALLPIERQAQAIAIEDIRRKAVASGQGAQWDELLNTIQPIHNPQSVLEGATSMSTEEAARLEVGLLRTSRSSLENLISRPNNLERLSLEELATATSEAEKLVDTMYSGTTRGSHIIKIKADNLTAGENLSNTDAVAIYYGSSKATGLASERSVHQIAKKLQIDQYVPEQINGQWYVKTYQHVDEKTPTLQAFARPNEKYTDKPTRTWLHGVLSRVRMRDSLVPTQLSEDFKVAQAGTNQYFHANRTQFIEDFAGLRGQSKRDLDSFLERERDYREQTGPSSDPTAVTRGRYAHNVGEFQTRWMAEMGRTPTFQETKSYFSWKTWNDVDYAVRNLDLTRDMVRLGIMDHELRFRIPGQDGDYFTPKLEGKVLTDMRVVWNRKGDAGILIWDVNPQTENSFRKAFLPDKSPATVEGGYSKIARGKSTISKEYIDDLVQNKGYAVLHLSPHAKQRLADHLGSYGGPDAVFQPPKDPLHIGPGGVEAATESGKVTYTVKDVRKAVNDMLKERTGGSQVTVDDLLARFPGASRNQIDPILEHLQERNMIYTKNGTIGYKKLTAEQAQTHSFGLYEEKIDDLRRQLAQGYPKSAESGDFNLSAFYNEQTRSTHEMGQKGFMDWTNNAIKSGYIRVTNPDTGELVQKIGPQHLSADAPDLQYHFNRPVPEKTTKDLSFTVDNTVLKTEEKYRIPVGKPIQISEGRDTIFSISKQEEGFTIRKTFRVDKKAAQREALSEDGTWNIIKKGEEKVTPKKYYETREEAFLAAREQQNKYIDELGIQKPEEKGPILGVGDLNVGDQVDLGGGKPAATIRMFRQKEGTFHAVLDNQQEVPYNEVNKVKPAGKVRFEPNEEVLPETKRQGYEDVKILSKGKHVANMRYKIEGSTMTIDMISSTAMPRRGAAIKAGSTVAHTVTTRTIKDVVEQIKEDFPDITTLKGARVSGARRGKAAPIQDPTAVIEPSEISLGPARTRPAPEARYGEPPEGPTLPGLPTAPKGPEGIPGWKIPNYDYIVVRPEQDMRSSNLGFVRFPYQEGGHKLATDSWWIRQPQIFSHTKDKATINTYTGDKNAYSAVIESDARDFHTHLENIRSVLDGDLANGTNNAEAYYNRYMDGTSKSFKDFKNQFREFHDDGHLTTKTPFVVTSGQKSAWDYMHSLVDKDGHPVFGNLENARDSEHNLFHNELNLQYALQRSDNLEQVVRKGTAQAPIFGTQPQGNLSPMATLINSTSQLIRGRIIDDLKIKSAESFGKAYASVIDAPLELVRRDPMNYILNPQWKQGLKGADLILQNSAKDYRRALVDFMGIEDTSREWLMTLQRSTADGLKRVLGQGRYDWIDRHLLRSGTINPIRFANAVVFDEFFGLFNLKQLAVQGMTAYHTVAVLGPELGLNAGWAAWAARPLIFNDNLARLEQFSKFIEGMSYGKFKAKWFQEAVTSLKNSGWHIIGGETALEDDFLNKSIKGSMLQRGREAARIFFKEGDRYTRNTSYMGAYLEWRTANPTAELTPRIEKEILNRADTLSLNMTAASNASIAKGAAAIPLKFTTYYARMMEQLLPGAGTLTAKEKMRAYAAYSVMFGAPVTAGGVFGLWPFHKEWAKILQDRGYDTDENKALQFFNGGLSELLPGLLGIHQNFAEALGPTGSDWLYDVVNGRSPLFDLVTGVAGTKVADTYENAWPLFTFMANAFRADEKAYPLSWADLEALARTPSSVNSVWKSIQMYNTGIYATKSMTPLAKGQDGVDALMTLLFGTEPKSVQKAFIQTDMLRSTKAMKDAAQKDILRYHRLQMKALSEDDADAAVQYGKEMKYNIIKNGFTPDEMNKLFSDAVTVNGDLVNTVQKKWNNSTPDRMKLYMDKIRGKEQQ